MGLASAKVSCDAESDSNCKPWRLIDRNHITRLYYRGKKWFACGEGKVHGRTQLVAFVTKHTGMFKRVRYDRYDPRVLKQMYGCPESDLSYIRPTGQPDWTLRWWIFPGIMSCTGCHEKPGQISRLMSERLLKYFRKRHVNTSDSINSNLGRLTFANSKFVETKAFYV